MKTKVILKENTEPKVGTLYTSVYNGAVVLCTNDKGSDIECFSGVCLHKGKSPCEAGQYHTNWMKEVFTDFHGTLKLKND